MTIKTQQQLLDFEAKLIDHVNFSGLTLEEARAIQSILSSKVKSTLRLQWSQNRDGDWQAHYRDYYLTISESSPTIKVIHFRPMGGTIQWYNSSIDEAINDILILAKLNALC